MPEMIPMATVRVHRDGKNITPPIGKPFNFTKEEVASVKAHNFFALRMPQNESVAMTETELLTGKVAEEDPDKVPDANMLTKAKPKAKGARGMQGGGMNAVDDDDDETL